MLRQNRILLSLITVLFVLILPAQALAAYAYNYGRTSDFNYADDCVSYANAAWSKLGLTYRSYLGSSFKESTFLSNCKYGNGVYAYTHGDPDAILDNGSGYITRS